MVTSSDVARGLALLRFCFEDSNDVLDLAAAAFLIDPAAAYELLNRLPLGDVPGMVELACRAVELLRRCGLINVLELASMGVATPRHVVDLLGERRAAVVIGALMRPMGPAYAPTHGLYIAAALCSAGERGEESSASS